MDLRNTYRSLNQEDKGELLLDGLWGLEKESQRVTISGDLALTPHPSALGGKADNPFVTVDFAESQIELITPAFPSVEEAHSFLERTQEQVVSVLNEEMLWPLSMPPRLPDEADIPIARFDGSEEGRRREIYRTGLALRYGKRMQMISGIHYNFSFGKNLLDEIYQRSGQGRDKTEFINELYLSTARNYLRYRWLLIYLYGASPAVDDSYRPEIARELAEVARCCPACCDRLENYRRFATSLRVSRFGYSNAVQSRYKVSFNSLKDHIRDLRQLLATENEAYQQIGLMRDGHQVQLNTYVLQKESEFYSPIRFKQTLRPGETQLDALEQRGIQYLEIRILDLNPFERTGISLEQLHLLQVFMLFCLFTPEEPLTETEWETANKNHHLSALFGRKPGLSLFPYDGRPSVSLRDWGLDLLGQFRDIAGFMDRFHDKSPYKSAVETGVRMIETPSLIPSARISSEMKKCGEDHVGFGLRRAARKIPAPAYDMKEDFSDGINGELRWVGVIHPNPDQGSAQQGSCCGAS